MGRKQIRPSQFVTTYGSGSLVALPDGHVVIPTVTTIVNDLKKIMKFNERNDNGLSGLDKFAIKDPKMERILLSRFSDDKIQIGIFRLPTNADLQEPEVKPLFKLILFLDGLYVTSIPTLRFFPDLNQQDQA